MNQKLLAFLRVIGYTAFFGALNALLNYATQSTALSGLIALAATTYGGMLEHDLAVKLGYNLTPTQAAQLTNVSTAPVSGTGTGLSGK